MAEALDFSASLTELAADIAETEHAFRLATECGFADLIALIKARLAELLPVLHLAMAAADADQRKALARQYRRLEALLRYSPLPRPGGC